MTDDDIFHRLICAWNGHDPMTVEPKIGPANEVTKQAWLRVYREACAIKQDAMVALIHSGD